MAFKAKTITLEESIALKEDLADSVHVEVTSQKEELRASDDEKEDKGEKKKRERKTTKRASKRVNWDQVVKDSDVDYGKWQAYKRITLVKPLELVDTYEHQNVAVPTEVLRKLDRLCKYNPSVHMKTIVANLIIDFLEKNQDILDLMESQYNKKR